MLPTLNICFIWHMHQPSYKDHLTGRYLMPWVRLHGVKDYLDMVTILRDFPQIRQTFNLVPSLIDQIDDYTRPGVWDAHQELTLKADFDAAEARYILERFFDAHPHNMIGRSPYYYQLLERRNRVGTEEAGILAFTRQELADITALFHLVWIDPQFFDEIPELAALWAQGRDYTVTDRQRILEIHREILSRILPTYRAFQEAGQIEVTTTPYYHPILPLLVDTDSAKAGYPGTSLPTQRFCHPEDAQAHLEKAIARYQGIFGRPPTGLWPSEQSISPAVLQLLRNTGIQWAVSDEGNLARSLGIYWDKDEYGNPRNVHTLSQPYDYEGVNLLFRNLNLSDLIGFCYAHMDAQAAADDCYHRLKHIQHQMAAHPGVSQPVVTIALDGENCWESYHQDGAPFLRALYQRLSEDDTLNVTRVCDYFAQQKPTVTPLANLHAGSWIDSDFHIWIGEPVKNIAWDHLSNTRADLVRITGEKAFPPEVLEKAWNELYVAQGSDWFWWYGEPHHSGQDERFDFQFRLHLQNIYTLLGETPPEILETPLIALAGRPVHEPTQTIRPVLDGQLTDAAEWEGAGRFDWARGSGAMHRGDQPISRFYYGCDDQFFYFRLDYRREYLKPNHRLTLYFCTPGKTRYNSPMRLKVSPSLSVPLRLYHYGFELALPALLTDSARVLSGEAVADHLWLDRPDIVVRAASGAEMLELAVPFDGLHTGPGESLQFTVALSEHEVATAFAPPDFLLTVTRPVITPPEKPASVPLSVEI